MPEDTSSHPHLTDMLERAVTAVGGDPRPGQTRMARAIAQCMANKRHLVAQAGTGTGKSLAYLVPALLHALETKQPIVVATATLALQNQIVTKDLPRLVDALAPHLPRAPEFALLKGRSNYLCVHKLNGGYPPDDEPQPLFREALVHDDARKPESLTEQIQRLHEWARVTSTGDRDELAVGVSNRAWASVCVTAQQCLARACPMRDECFAERQRAVAKEADVIVTNHALYAIDAFDERRIIPEHDVVIIDEAHDFIDRVTAATTQSLTHSSVRAAVRELRALAVASTALDEAGRAYADALAALPAGRIIGDMEPRLHDRITALGVEARRAHSDAKDAGDGSAASTAGARKTVRTRLQEIVDVCERLTSPHEDDVVYVSHSEISGRTSMEVAPLSVAGKVRSTILSDTTTILTSATLVSADRFAPAAASFGLARENRVDVDEPMASFLKRSQGAQREQWSALDVGSPFNYGKQGILYTARHVPPPGRDGISQVALEHLTELIRAARGGALGLFSSRRAADDAAAYVRAHTDMTVLLQGEGSVGSLVQAFRDDSDSCLFGSRALWQGVDVAGAACRLVIIDRIPFPRPDDPVASARKERADSRGANGFMSVTAHEAALLMAQGAGRLVRSARDRGMVAVLDPRLETARYGTYIRAAMPPLWRTSDHTVAIAALERLAAAVPSD